METRRHAQRPTKPDQALLKCLEGRKTYQAEATTFAHDKKEAIRTEITRLLAAGFIKEVYHPDWLANPVLVRKRTMNGECALITLISINTILKILLVSLALTKWSTQWPDANSSLF